MKRAPVVAVLDFETEAIQRRPLYPPRPVGVSVKLPGDRKSTYYAWGHPTGNNCTFEQARGALARALEYEVLFHNAKFDLDVLETHMGLKAPAWDRVHDTMFLLFLTDPHASTFALKPSAERLLGLAPEERDAVRDWLVQAGICRKAEKGWGAHIAEAPGGLVGKYADGDVLRTETLFKLLYPRVHADDMLCAYDRERELMPILLANERVGMRVDMKRLQADMQMYQKALAATDAWLCKRLGAKDMNVDSDAELADALEAKGVVTSFALTDTGRRSTSKKTLTADRFTDKKVFAAMGYRNRLATCLKTFMGPWLEMGEAGNGYIFTNWNQVRQSGSGDNSRGARTGRLSSNPNFQNIPTAFEGKDDDYTHPKHLSVPELPFMRRYILPDKGGILGDRDYSQQELRILAHYEDDKLLEAYRERPDMDVHTFVQSEIERVAGLHLERKAVKVLNFGMVYGMGLAKLAIGIKSSVDEAKVVKQAQRSAIPGLKELEQGIKGMGKSGVPIRTWGGRRYFCEPPKIVDGRTQTYEYKLLNYLIQGSAADCTKQAVINYHNAGPKARFMATVHDEVLISIPKGRVKEEMAVLRTAMESVEFDLPMLSEGKTGANWHELKAYKEPK